MTEARCRRASCRRHRVHGEPSEPRATVAVCGPLANNTMSCKLTLACAFARGASASKSKLSRINLSAQKAKVCARGLQSLHGLGMVHQDLKPGNVLMYGGSLKIADFGL